MHPKDTPQRPNSVCAYCGTPFVSHSYTKQGMRVESRFCSRLCMQRGKHGRTLAMNTPFDLGDGTAVVFLGSGRTSLIDADDIPRVGEFAWRLSNAKDRPDYASTSVGRHQVYLHRFVIDAPDGVIVDHVNRDGLDNRKANLRLATGTLNMANTMRRSDGSSEYKGVKIRHDGKKWCARIQINGKGIHLGSFVTAAEAARAYDAKARELFGEFAVLNFPEDHDIAA